MFGPGLLFPVIDKLVKVFEAIANKKDYSYEDCFSRFSEAQEELVQCDGC